MEVELRTTIDRCLQGPPIICADAQIIEMGQVETYNTAVAATKDNVHVAAAAADGATQRAVDVAAGKLARNDRYTPLLVVEDCVVKKMAADDAITAGVPLWFSVDDNVFVSALAKVDAAGVCFQCAWSLELSNDPADTIRVTFDGRGVAGEAGTGT